MGIGKKLLEFLFGKDPDIFDDNGEVRHKLPDQMWQSWHQRTKLDPQYNWRNHSGASAGRSSRFKKPSI